METRKMIIPVEPGCSLALVHYHVDVDTDSSREFTKRGGITTGMDLGEDLLTPMIKWSPVLNNI